MTYATGRWAAERLTEVSARAEVLTRAIAGDVLSIGCDALTGAVRIEYQLDDDWGGNPATVAEQIANGLVDLAADLRVEVYRGDDRWDAILTSAPLPSAA